MLALVAAASLARPEEGTQIRSRLGLVIALGLLVAATAAAAVRGSFPIAGKWSSSAAGAKWLVTIDASGHYRIARDGKLAVKGSATVNGKVITFGHESGPFACKGAAATGRYRYARTAAGLKLTAISDRCPGRRAVLLSPLKSS